LKPQIFRRRPVIEIFGWSSEKGHFLLLSNLAKGKHGKEKEGIELNRQQNRSNAGNA
jgi:hypothetical protein